VAIEKMVELTGGGGDELRFTQADILIDLDRYDEAEAVIESVKEPVYKTLIRGRIQLAKGDPAAALASFDVGVRQWPNNSGARYLAGMAAYELGDWERAITEMREAMRADQSRADAPHMLARIYFERKDYAEAVKFSTAAVRRGRDNREPADYILATRALTQLGEYEKARNAASILAEIPGQMPVATAELAHVARAETGPQSAVDTITDSGLDLALVENSEALRVLVENLLALDQASKALARVDAALAQNAEAADLHTIRGTVLVRLRRNADAIAAFEQALRIEPDDAAALAGLATVAGNERNFAKAVELFDRAEAASEESTGTHAYAAAQLSMKLGDQDDTIERLRKIVKEHPGHSGARNDLAWILAERGDDLDTARDLAEDASRLQASAEILDTLGWVYIQRGEGALAVKALEEAHRQKADSASIRYHLGMALALAGDSARAREMFESALDSEGFDDAEAARRELAKLGS